MSSFLYRMGRACYRRRGRVLAGWLVVLAVLGGLTLTIGGAFDDAFKIPGAESTIALNQLKVTFPEAADATATVLITAPEGSRMEDKAVRTAVESWIDRMEDLPFVNGVIGPYSEVVDGEDVIDGLISADGGSGRATIRVDGTISTFTDAQREELTATAQTLHDTLPGSRVLVGGEVFSTHLPTLSVVEALGLVVALIVLLVTLGSVVASAMPIATAITGVGIGVMLVKLGAGVFEVSSTTLILAIMLGLAVGIDYALFVISRHRDQLAAGMDVEESAARSIGTAGSAVVFAGLTVIIALVGLSISGVPFLSVMGIFAAITVAFEVVLALTLLPALMGFAGERLRPKAKASARPPSPTGAPPNAELSESVPAMAGTDSDNSALGGAPVGDGGLAEAFALGRSRSPAKPIRAGSRVSASTTSKATVIAAKMPITDRKGTPEMLSPTSAMITVRPAKTTADPAVPIERAADSSTSMPAASWSRCREITNRA